MREMSVMTDRLARAQSEAQQLRAEREEVHAQLRDLEGMLSTSSSRGGEMSRLDLDLGEVPTDHHAAAGR